jgi:hypothetical protein
MSGIKLDNNPETPKRFNQLAREQLKTKLLNDIVIDLQICEIEGWDKKEYLLELQELINSFMVGEYAVTK